MANVLCRLLVFLGAARVTRGKHLDKKFLRVSKFLQPPAINKELESNPKMYVNQWRKEMVWKIEQNFCHEHFGGKYQNFIVFPSAAFNHSSLEGFFSNQQELIVGAPRAYFCQNLKWRNLAEHQAFGRYPGKTGSQWKLCFVIHYGTHRTWCVWHCTVDQPHPKYNMVPFSRNLAPQQVPYLLLAYNLAVKPCLSIL